MPIKKTTTRKKATTRRTTAIKAHAERAKTVKNEVESIQAAFHTDEGKYIAEQLVAKVQRFQEWHNRIAQDGVASKIVGTGTDGTPQVEVVTLGDRERTQHLDKSAGMQEILDYLDRQVHPEKYTDTQK